MFPSCAYGKMWCIFMYVLCAVRMLCTMWEVNTNLNGRTRHETKIENEAAEKRENLLTCKLHFCCTPLLIHMFHVPWFMPKMNYIAGAMLLVCLSLQFHIFIPLLVASLWWMKWNRKIAIHKWKHILCNGPANRIHPENELIPFNCTTRDRSVEFQSLHMQRFSIGKCNFSA